MNMSPLMALFATTLFSLTVDAIANPTLSNAPLLKDCDNNCLKCPDICKNGLKCETGGSGGVCVQCTGQYETPCGTHCCLSGQECHQGSWGSSCTEPLLKKTPSRVAVVTGATGRTGSLIYANLK